MIAMVRTSHILQMKKTLLALLLALPLLVTAQQRLTLKKGAIIDGIKVNDTLSENFALYLPTNFEIEKKWPVIFVYDLQGRGKQAISMFRQAAEEQGYIVAASNSIHDSLPLSKNVLISSRMFNMLNSIVPIQRNRSYTAGFSDGARLASLMPTFVKEIRGVISCGSPVANMEVLSIKNPFHFVGIVGVEDYNYRQMLNAQKVLNKLRFPNQLLVFEGGHEWPESNYIAKAMEILTISAMTKNEAPRAMAFIDNAYQKSLGEANALVTAQQPLLANHLLNQIIKVYGPLKGVDSLKASSKTLKKTKLYRTQSRSQNAVFFRESLVKDDYVYYLEEDVLTYNYNNLGWWKYQMEQLEKYEKGTNIFEKQMGRRLKGYINALIADNIDMLKAEDPIDDEALNFLWMLNTITEPTSYDPYLKVISYSSKIEDYGTALFYLEELLKNGYTNKEELYELEHTALFRISPEFNEMVQKYLKDARYDVIEN